MERNRASYKSTKDSRYPDNSVGAIDAYIDRAMHEDAADSFLNIVDDVDIDPTLAANSDDVVPSQAAIKSYIDNRVGAAVGTHYKTGLNVAVFQASVVGSMNVGSLADGDSITIIVQVAGKDDSSNTGFGGQYITTWTIAGGVMNFVSESGATMGIDTGGTATMSSSDGGSGQVSLTMTIGGGTGNASYFIRATYIQFVA